MTVILYLCLLIAGIFIMTFLGHREIKNLLFPDGSQIDAEPVKEVLTQNSFGSVKEITPYPDYRKRFVISDTTTEIDIAHANIVRFGPYLHSCSINGWEVGGQLDGEFIIASDGNFIAFLFTEYFELTTKLLIYDMKEQTYVSLNQEISRLISFESNLLVYEFNNKTIELDISHIDKWEVVNRD